MMTFKAMASTVLALALGAGVASAQQLDPPIDAQVGSNETSAESQKRVEDIATATDSLTADYRLTLKKIESLQIFNRQLSQVIDSQNEELFGRLPVPLRDTDGSGGFVEGGLEACKEAYHLDVVAFCRPVSRSPTVVVRRVDVCPELDQQLHQVYLPAFHRCDEWCGALTKDLLELLHPEIA